MFNKTKEQFDRILSLVESFDARLTEFGYRLEEIESNSSFTENMVADIKHEVYVIEDTVLEINDYISKLETD